MTETLKILNNQQLPKSRVILALMECLRENNGVWAASQIRLAHEIFCSRNRLSQVLNQLAKTGVVEFGAKERFNSPKIIRLINPERKGELNDGEL